MGARTNRLLDTLSRSEYEALQSSMRRIPRTPGQILLEQDEPIQHLYFPTSAVISLLTVLDSGDVREHVMIGRDGMIGFPIVLGESRSIWRSLVQMPGEILAVSTAELRAHGDIFEGLHKLTTRYALLMLRLTGQAAACAATHRVEERTARALLRLQDETEVDDLPITHEFLALLLGVHRQTVTLAAGSLQRTGLIRYGRGHITVLDRAGLEAATCECYGVMRRAVERLFD